MFNHDIFLTESNTYTDFFEGEQHVFRFENGYGASVIRNNFSYGYEDGLWEVAVLGKDGELCFDTPITDGVIGVLSDLEVEETLRQIRAL